MKTISIINVCILLQCSISWSQCIVNTTVGQGLSGNCGSLIIQGYISQNARLYGNCGGYQFTSPITDDDFSTGILEVKVDEVSLYPNPTSNYIKMLFPKKLQISHLFIFDLMGREIASKLIYNNSSEIDLEVENLKSGYYIIKIYNLQKLITHKSFLKF